MPRLLGTISLAIGSGLLLSGPLLGQDLLIELVGENVATFRLICALAVVLGALAVAFGVRDEREANTSEAQHKSTEL
jgi:dihydroxyacetone kinase DhaKLM complex PTS-EIIA-like component DhaM